MAVRIRLTRMGRTHLPYYRVVATDSRVKRDGKACEVLGIYDPLAKDKNVQIDIEKVHGWIRRGARYTGSVESLVRHNGYEPYPAETLEVQEKQKARRKARRAQRRKSTETPKGTYVAPKRRAVKRHAAKLKAERMAKLREEQEARDKAKAEAEAEAAAAAAESQAAEAAPAEGETSES